MKEKSMYILGPDFFISEYMFEERLEKIIRYMIVDKNVKTFCFGQFGSLNYFFTRILQNLKK